MTTPYACTTPAQDQVPRPGGQLVGRGTETGRIADALAQARSGRGGTVIVTGEPGVGKTRLTAEAITAARDAGMATARGRAGTVGPAVPYRPLVEALLALSRAEPASEEPGGPAPLPARLLADPHGTEAAAVSPLMVAEEVLRLIAAAGRGRGCLLVLDDLHEADPGTLAVVEYLLDNLGHLPAVLLLTAERGPCGAVALAARARQDGVATVIDLTPLGRSAVRRLVASELGIAPEQVSPALVHRAATDGAGLPFVVKELVHGLGGVAQNLRLRAARLGPRGEEFLNLAALLGPRFPLPVLRHAAGCDQAGLTALLRAATAASLLVPDGPGTDWYAFRYPLAAEALRDALGPVEHPALARRAADALTALHPRLPGTWCARAAELHERAGDTTEAVRGYTEAARRATAEGAPDRALDLLARAHRLSDPDTAPEPHAAVLARLLDAVGSSGRLDRLPAAPVSGPPDGRPDHPWEPGPTVPPSLRAGLHARLAEIQVQAGRPVEGLRHLDLARRLLAGQEADAGAVARVELAAALVEPARLAPERLRTAEESARRAVDAAHRAQLPEVAGRALLALARLLREQDETAAVARLEEARSLAEAHHLPGVRLSAELGLARVEARRDGRTAPVERARTEALRAGLLPTAHEAGLELALDRVRRGAFDSAGELVDEGIAEATRLGLGRALSRWRLVDAVRWAHQGRRAEMDEALRRLAPLVDNAPGLRPVAYGLARGFCSLLEEDHEGVERDFAQALAYDAENPGTGEFGRHGVVLLLGVLAGRMGRRHHAGVVAASAAGARWNRPFVGLAHAVLLGREGRTAEATAAATAALDAAAPYPVARHLCLRLVARSAYEDGWGAPVEWLREAEEFFHGAGLPAPAGACRSLLRGMGAPVRQRRSGADRVPPGLRRCGITVREFEVARLLAERFGNRDIAGRLHISPRTVEKHVSSLLQKTGHPTRAAFASAARELVAGPAV